MNVKFYELAIGARFECRGKHYEKVAMSVVEEVGDKRRWGTVFMGTTDVVSDGPLLPPEEAAKWKPDYGIWTDVVNGDWKWSNGVVE